MTEHESVTLQEGRWGRIVGMRLPDGSCPSADWLIGLSERGQAGMKARLERLAETGNQKTPENFRKISESGQPVVFEVKHVGLNLRLFVVKGHHVYYATHGCTKPKKNRLAQEVARAREIYNKVQG